MSKNKYKITYQYEAVDEKFKGHVIITKEKILELDTYYKVDTQRLDYSDYDNPILARKIINYLINEVKKIEGNDIRISHIRTIRKATKKPPNN